MHQEINRLVALYSAGRYAEAQDLARAMSEQFPSHPFAWKVLGALSMQSGRCAEALVCMQRAVSLAPEDAEAHNNLGIVQKSYGQNEDAVVSYQRALMAKPDYVDALINLSTAQADLGQLSDAMDSCRRALEIKPDSVEALSNLGNAQVMAGHFQDALASCRQALALNSDFVQAHINLGNALKSLGNTKDAIAHYQRALEIKSDYVDAYVNLGTALADLGETDEAIAAFNQGLKIQPDNTDALVAAGNALMDLGHLDDAIKHYRRALELKPKFIKAHSNMLFCLNYHPDQTAEAIYAEYDRWDQLHASHLCGPLLHTGHLELNRKLKIGYVSPDFRRHSASQFIELLLSRHDANNFEIFAYAQVWVEDEITSKFKTYVNHWQNTVGMSDESLAQKIRQDKIDILVDLAGHTAGNRLLVFARKPAPIQVSWLGYGYTTGLKAIDYYLADKHFAPVGSEKLFSEKLLRLPVVSAYRPQVGMGEVGSLPALGTKIITFGSLTRSVRINNRVIHVWAEILNRLANSRLVINSANYRSESMQRGLREKFEAHGIAPHRLIVGYESPPWDVLRQIDICLDCFPHNSGTTLYESLYMGVPFVSLAGRPSVGRIGSALLHAVGHPEWIAATEADYVERAVKLAMNLHTLAEIRNKLRREVEVSALMNEAAFVQSIERSFRDMWKTLCDARTAH